MPWFVLVISYGLFAALSTILKEDMTKYLEVIVRNMITSVKSTEGVTVSVNSFRATYAYSWFPRVIVILEKSLPRQIPPKIINKKIFFFHKIEILKFKKNKIKKQLN